jgi:hypothetical protein
VTVGLLSFAVPPFGFNGGKLQVQSDFLQNGGDFPFVNLLLGAQSWSFADNSGWPSPNVLDPTTGLPTSISNGGVSTVFQIPAQSDRSGNYYVITTGKGTISSTGLTSTAVNGTNVQTLISGAALGSNTQITFNITATDATTPITKVAFVHNQDVSAYLADNLAFGGKFIPILQQLKPGVIRFLNWQNGNLTNETTWSSRKPQTHWSFASQYFPTQKTDSVLGCQVGYLGSTTSTLNDYVVSDSGGTAAPVDKQTVMVNFDAAAVTVTSGANAQISWTGHGLSTGSPFMLFTTVAGSVPGGLTLYPSGAGGAVIFYAIFVDANTVQFATTYANAIANTAITTSSTGSGVLAHATVVNSAVTITVSTSNVAWANHGLSTGDPIGFGGNNPCGNVSLGINYYAIVIDANNINIATSRANALSSTKVTFTGSAGGGVIACRLPTLSLNGTGAVPIRASGGQIMTINGNSMPLARAFQNHIVQGALTYDAALNSWIKAGGDAADGNIGIRGNVPPEICLKLCTLIGAHPYFVSGYLMLDPMTDYMPSLMTYCQNNAPSWMIPRFEAYNENWNNVTPGSNYAQFKAFANWGVQEFPAHNWVGKTCSTLGQAAANVWSGGKGTKYHVLVGVQTPGIVDASSASQSNNRLVAAQYTAQAAAAQSPYTKTAAYQWCTHVCCAQYLTPTLYGTTSGNPNESSMASTWAANGSLPNDALLTTYVDSITGAAANFNLAQLQTNYSAIFAWAQGAGVSGGWAGSYKLGMCGYEGGYSPSLFASTTQIYNFRVATKFGADVGIGLNGGTLVNGSTVAGALNDFISAGGVFPSCFQLAGGTGTGSGNAWSVLDPTIYLSPQPAQWTALVAFSNT